MLALYSVTILTAASIKFFPPRLTDRAVSPFLVVTMLSVVGALTKEQFHSVRESLCRLQCLEFVVAILCLIPRMMKAVAMILVGAMKTTKTMTRKV